MTSNFAHRTVFLGGIVYQNVSMDNKMHKKMGERKAHGNPWKASHGCQFLPIGHNVTTFFLHPTSRQNPTVVNMHNYERRVQ